ncbi:MAG: homoserine dehydrogenase, partial [Oscillospiraceae bacterium]|nr:homoserine dehydrogenase [Oscillospiraceae bacterium]
GSGVVEVMEKNKAVIEKKAGQTMEVTRILDLREFPGLPYSDKFTKDFQDILNDDEISVVAEVMGGIHPAYEFVTACLEIGKSVVTSNKALVAAKGAELLATAKANDVNFFFEASVGGGIPIIQPLHLCLSANEIDEIAGILNGTTNFILTKMIHEQMPFDEALKLAQELGYAEKDPTADIEGHDACRKICILASLCYGKHVYPESVHTEGITKLTLEDVAYAEDWGGVIKLIGRAKKMENGMVSAMVSPAFIPHDSQLASINDVFNGILVRGNATGDVVFYGKGAGKLPTASAVVSDIITAAKEAHTSNSLTWVDCHEDYVADHKDGEVGFYLRFASNDPNAKTKVVAKLGEVRFLSRSNQPVNEFAVVTDVMNEGRLEELLDSLSKENIELLGKIRVLDY